MKDLLNIYEIISDMQKTLKNIIKLILIFGVFILVYIIGIFFYIAWRLQ